MSSTRENCCENIKLKLICIKSSNRSLVEMRNVRFVFLYQDFNKYGHADIDKYEDR